uniref:Nanog homeobox n=1 Tax=Sinocyclocheilus grahami TaxID=75366 RepID=A0A672T5S9_SINGR
VSQVCEKMTDFILNGIVRIPFLNSWSSGSSREGAALTNLNLQSWGDRDYETDSGSPDSGEQISNSISAAREEPVSLNLGVEALPPLPALTTSTARPPTQTRKTRAAFSEEQMSALIHRFNIQRYLTPAEMKTLAGATGLTYKQVKTWFQNRRMKLKRHQRDSSWMTERYVVNSSFMSNHVIPYLYDFISFVENKTFLEGCFY